MPIVAAGFAWLGGPDFDITQLVKLNHPDENLRRLRTTFGNIKQLRRHKMEQRLIKQQHVASVEKAGALQDDAQSKWRSDTQAQAPTRAAPAISDLPPASLPTLQTDANAKAPRADADKAAPVADATSSIQPNPTPLPSASESAVASTAAGDAPANPEAKAESGGAGPQQKAVREPQAGSDSVWDSRNDAVMSLWYVLNASPAAMLKLQRCM